MFTLPRFFALTFCATACALDHTAHAVQAESHVATSFELGSLSAVPATRARVLMVPPTTNIPRTGGERNMDFFAQGLHRDYQVTVFTPPGPLASCYDALNIAVEHPADLCIQAGDFAFVERVVQAAIEQIDATMQCARATGHAYASEGVPARELAPLAALVAQLDGMLLSCNASVYPDAKSLDTMSLPRPLMQGLRLRRAVHNTQSEVVFADLSRDAVAAVVGLAGTGTRILWYPQMTEPQDVDTFLEAHTQVVTCGEGVRQHRFAGRAHVAAVPNGIDEERFVPRKTGDPRPELLREGGDDALVIGNVAGIYARKNQALLVQALAERLDQLRNAHLYFIGVVQDATYEARVMELAATLNISDRVHFVPNQEDIEKWIPHFDIFVLPSWTEGMPLALLEAMSCEVACLASDIPSTQEMAGEGVSYFPPGDARILGDQLVALATSPAQRARMGRAGRATVLQQGFTSDAMLHNMSQQISRLAQSRTPQ